MVGSTDGWVEGKVVGTTDGETEGSVEGEVDGNVDGMTEGLVEGRTVGSTEGATVGSTDGDVDGYLKLIQIEKKKIPQKRQLRSETCHMKLKLFYKTHKFLNYFSFYILIGNKYQIL